MSTTCLHCTSQSSLLAPPHNPLLDPEPASTEQRPSSTTNTSKPLDGPIRRKRRGRLVRPVPFWQRPDHLVVPTNELHRYVPPAGAGGKESNKRQPKQEKGQGKNKGQAKGEVQVEKAERKQKGKKDIVLETTTAIPKPVPPPTQPLAVSAEIDEEEMMNML
jgi:hypothetical protein